MAEFLEAPPALAERITVLDENFEPSSDSSVIVVSLRDSSAITLLQPSLVDGTPVWQTVFEPRADRVSLDAEGIAALARDLDDLASLCAWLQRCTDEVLRSTD